MHENRLRELRRAAGMSQSDIAEMLGVDRSVASRYESGDVPISDARKLKLAEHFGCSVPWLMGWEETPNGNNDGVEVAA